MKKTFFICFVLIAGVMSAQVSHPRDTIVGPDTTTYMYNIWFDSADCDYDELPDCPLFFPFATLHQEIANYYNTDTPIKLAGIAAAITTCYDSKYLWPWFDGDRWGGQYYIADTTFDNWEEYLRLYQLTDTGMVMIAENGYNALDTSRSMKIFYNYWGYGDPRLNPDISVHSLILPLYETFFEKPIEIQGEFCVSATNLHSIPDLNTHTFRGYDARLNGVCSSAGCWTQRVFYKELHGNDVWRRVDCNHLFFIFPIIDTTGSYRVPDSCKGVRNFEMPYQDSNYAYLTWERGRFNQSYQVAYGPAEDDPESYTVDTCSTEGYMLRSLTPGVEYAARVRGTCFEGEAFSEWSDTVRFVRRTGTEGIASQLAPYATLSPNPACGRVTVASSAELRRVTLYDLQGRAALDQDAAGLTAELDVQSLPAGLYIAAILTTKGLTTQKLTVK